MITQRYASGSMGTSKGFTGLDYYNARYYDPVVGVFLSADTVQGNLQGMNPYNYVGGNPETRNDPTGRYIPCPDDGCGSGGGGGSPPPSGGHSSHGPLSSCDPSVDACSSPTKPLLPSTISRGALFWRCAADPQCAHVLRAYQNALVGQMLLDALGIFGSLLEMALAFGVENEAAWEQGEEELQVLTEEGAVGRMLERDLACSFTPDTLVQTVHGKQAIGTLHAGDHVLAYNAKTHTMEWQPIVHVWVHTDDDLVNLTITTSAQQYHGKGIQRQQPQTSEVIHTNKKHPFFTLEHGFLPVGQMTVGMHLLRGDGRIGIITRWQIVRGIKTMYNLEVAQDHTFTVGIGEWVVHNCAVGPFDDAMLKQYEQGDAADKVEAEAGILTQMYSEVTGFKTEFKDPVTGQVKAEFDVEAPNFLIEATTVQEGKWSQISSKYMNPAYNPSGKPVILYAPNYTNGAMRFLQQRGVYVARSEQELIEYIVELSE